MRTLLFLVAGTLAVLVALYVLLPAVAGVGDTWARLREGSPWWLAAAAALEVVSFASYMMFFRAVFGRVSPAVGWRTSYLISMAGVAATRLLAVAGAGGIALTAWALRRLGIPGREVAAGMATFYVVLYGVYLAVVVILGVGLSSGLFSGPAPWGLTVLPAALAAGVIATALLIAILAQDLEAWGSRRGDAASWLLRAAAAIPATISSGVRGALRAVGSRDAGLLGALGWFGFDIAVLWASISAFGAPPALTVVVMSYFVGMAANTLPVPGGVGTVDAGMIGALIGFGVEPGLAIVSVLTYRAFAFWLPMVPGAAAYVRLLREPSAF